MQTYLKYFISYVIRDDGSSAILNGIISRTRPISNRADIEEIEKDIRIELKVENAMLISFSLLNDAIGE